MTKKALGQCHMPGHTHQEWACPLTMTCADCAVTSDVPSGEGVLLCQLHASVWRLLDAAKGALRHLEMLGEIDAISTRALHAVINEIERGKIA